MATALNQHKAIAMGKKPNPSPAAIAKFKKGGAVKVATFEKSKRDVEVPGQKESSSVEKKMDKKQMLPFKKGGKACK